MNPNEQHHTELIRGMASTALLAGFLAGVPILLFVGVGWPLPQGLPSGSEVSTAIKTGAISPSLVLKPISLVVWVLWLQMLAGMGIELWAHLRGRVAPRVALIPSFVQRLSARMIGTVLVVAFSIQHPGIATADNKDLLAPTTIEMDFKQPWGLGSSSEESRRVPGPSKNKTDAVNSEEPTEAKPLVHIVERRESLRMLAERYLGDPNRWTEVFVLNQGQPQAVGGSLADPARLQPGWELVMPADARQPASAEPNRETAPESSRALHHQLSTETEPNRETAPESSQPPVVPPAEFDDAMITVQREDTLWGLAAHHLSDPERWVDIFNSNQDIIQNPSVIVPGWQLQLPIHKPRIETPLFAESPINPRSEMMNHASPLTTPPSAVIEHASPVVAYSTAKSTVVANVLPSATDEGSAPDRQTMFAVGGLGVFASSLGWMLARLRRSQRRRLPSGRIPPSPTNEAAQLEQQLQTASDPDNALFLDLSLRVLSSRLLDTPPPGIIGTFLDSDGISILLETPAKAPLDFTSSEDGMTWKLSRDTPLERLMIEADRVPAPLPALVTIGQRDGYEFLLNLEHMVALNLEGDSEAISGLCAAMATQLASSHLADDLTVLCVGFGQDLTVFERVEYVPDVISAIERIENQVRQNRALLGNHLPLVGTRIGNSGDSWHPTVTLIPNRLNEEEASCLLDKCGSSVCVVAHGLNGANWIGKFDDCGLLLLPLDFQIEPRGLSSGAVSAVVELAVSAKDTEGVKLEVVPTPRPMSPDSDPSVVGPLAVDLEIRVIGTVDVLGAAQPFASRRALDLVAYLAFHPEGADRDQIRAHIWPPDNPPSKSTLANTVSRARKALGFGDDGEPYLPRVGPGGIYQLRAEVGTDVTRFETLVSAARNDTSERGRQLLQTALDLVRGTPFTGGTGDMYRWADFGLRAQIDCLVDTTAHELAKRCIDVGDTDSARNAVKTSLQLVGICEECYHWRLMAAAENPTEVRGILAELVGLLRRESNQPKADVLISPDLLGLYERLMSSRALFS